MTTADTFEGAATSRAFEATEPFDLVEHLDLRYRRAIIVGSPAHAARAALAATPPSVHKDQDGRQGGNGSRLPYEVPTTTVRPLPAGKCFLSVLDGNRLSARSVHQIAEPGVTWFGEKKADSQNLWRFAPDIQSSEIALTVERGNGRISFTKTALKVSGVRSQRQGLVIIADDPAIYLINPQELRIP